MIKSEFVKHRTATIFFFLARNFKETNESKYSRMDQVQFVENSL